MFDIGWSEFALVFILALILLGPKECISLFYTFGKWVGQMKRQLDAFHQQMEQTLDDQVDKPKKTKRNKTDGV